MKVSLLGPVGSGKGTQAQLVSGRLNYARVSTGDLVRDQIEAGTELGRELKGYSDRGEPVPDDIIMDLVRPQLQPAGGWILDGIPRTIQQARMLDEGLKERSAGALDHVIVLEGPSDEELIERITSGRRHSLATGRVYHLDHDPPPDPEKGEEAEAVKEYYEERGVLTVVDASQEISKITEDVLEALGHPNRV